MANIPRISINNINKVEPITLDRPVVWQGKPSTNRNNTNKYLFISKAAERKINTSLDWGGHTERNTVEQMGILLGRVYRNGNEVYSSVEDIILADTSGRSASVEMTEANWTEAQDKLADINSRRAPNERLIISGWFHTHPNNLSVFMSGTDNNTQTQHFAQDWQVSLVMNPHSGARRSFFGANNLEGNIAFMDFQDIIRNPYQPQIPQLQIMPNLETAIDSFVDFSAPQQKTFTNQRLQIVPREQMQAAERNEENSLQRLISGADTGNNRIIDRDSQFITTPDELTIQNADPRNPTSLTINRTNDPETPYIIIHKINERITIHSINKNLTGFRKVASDLLGFLKKARIEGYKAGVLPAPKIKIGGINQRNNDARR
ncbi:MAG: hypothetical protein LBL34_03520 [Clostridiales bacterium]|jgi:proteasome lid subunit RPN8/RPN11|nr:hypothetical protein [Clostridiales bacterium]